MPKSNPPSKPAAPDPAAAVKAALLANRHIAIQPSLTPGNVELSHREGEGGSFPAAEVAAVLLSGGDLDAYFNEKF